MGKEAKGVKEEEKGVIKLKGVSEVTGVKETGKATEILGGIETIGTKKGGIDQVGVKAGKGIGKKKLGIGRGTEKVGIAGASTGQVRRKRLVKSSTSTRRTQ